MICIIADDQGNHIPDQFIEAFRAIQQSYDNRPPYRLRNSYPHIARTSSLVTRFITNTMVYIKEQGGKEEIVRKEEERPSTKQIESSEMSREDIMERVEMDVQDEGIVEIVEIVGEEDVIDLTGEEGIEGIIDLTGEEEIIDLTGEEGLRTI